MIRARAILFASLVAIRAAADEPVRARTPAEVTGVERPAKEPGDTARAVADAALFLPRRAVELVYAATANAAGLVENEQLVPRARQLLFTEHYGIGLFPTLAIGGGFSPIVGARMVSGDQNTATTMLFAWGGENDWATEARVRSARPTPIPTAVSLEGRHDVRSTIGFAGVGEDPENDPRNRFREPSVARSAAYLERLERVLGTAGIRPASDLELFVSSSFTQRTIRDSPSGAPTLAEVFEPPSIPGANAATKIVYSEAAARLDTREERAAPLPGSLLELYGGSGRGILDDRTRFVRVGGRAATFVSIFRRTNVLSPKLVVDGIAPLDGSALPFEELPSQPEFRGAGDRRDHVSLVASLDYRWRIFRPVAGRIFGDVARVAPSVREMSSFDRVRVAVGLGADLFNANAEVGRVALAWSPEGVRFLFTLGVASSFGDRQHRE